MNILGYLSCAFFIWYSSVIKNSSHDFGVLKNLTLKKNSSDSHIFSKTLALTQTDYVLRVNIVFIGNSSMKS